MSNTPATRPGRASRRTRRHNIVWVLRWAALAVAVLGLGWAWTEHRNLWVAASVVSAVCTFTGTYLDRRQSPSPAASH